MRNKSSSVTSNQLETVVVDNGGFTIKCGFAAEKEPRFVIPNCSGKVQGERTTYVGDQVNSIKDITSIQLKRPIDRGYVVNWQLQKEIWNRVFYNLLGITPSQCWIIITEQLFALEDLHQQLEQIMLEEYNFQGCTIINPQILSLQYSRTIILESKLSNQTNEELIRAAKCGVVVDLGFSFSLIVPIFEDRILLSSVGRVDYGGKAMTNYLKELITYRSMNVMDQTYMVEQIKEEVSFVSQNIRQDLIQSKKSSTSPHRLEYVLPDGVQVTKGYILNPKNDSQTNKQNIQQQILILNNERFMVPEVLFRPLDIGLDQQGLPEAIYSCIQSVHPSIQGILYSNIIIVGGVSQLQGLQNRVYQDLRPLVPDIYELQVRTMEEPSLCAWKGASQMGKQGSKKVSKKGVKRSLKNEED